LIELICTPISPGRSSQQVALGWRPSVAPLVLDASCVGSTFLLLVIRLLSTSLISLVAGLSTSPDVAFGRMFFPPPPSLSCAAAIQRFRLVCVFCQSSSYLLKAIVDDDLSWADFLRRLTQPHAI